MRHPAVETPLFNVAHYIKQIREELGLSQQEMADRCSVSKADISRWENGERIPNVSHLQRLAVGLNLHLQVGLVRTSTAPRDAAMLAMMQLDPHVLDVALQLARQAAKNRGLLDTMTALADLTAPPSAKGDIRVATRMRQTRTSSNEDPKIRVNRSGAPPTRT